MLIPTKVFAWLPHETTETCNMVHACIAILLRVLTIIGGLGYITGAIIYIRYSEKEPKEKVKNILISLALFIIQIAILILGASWVKSIGMEEYWIDTGRINQTNIMRSYIPNMIRTFALASIMSYIITGITYFIKSRDKNKQKIINLAKWQIITIIIVVVLLLIATNW